MRDAKGIFLFMKITLEIEGGTLREAKISAAKQGVTLKELFNEALVEKLQKGKAARNDGEPAWLKLEGVFGKTPADREETRRVQAAIDAEFGRIEPEN